MSAWYADVVNWAKDNLNSEDYISRKEYLRDAIRKYKAMHGIKESRPANTYKPDSYYQGVAHRSVWPVGWPKRK